MMSGRRSRPFFLWTFATTTTSSRSCALVGVGRSSGSSFGEGGKKEEDAGNTGGRRRVLETYSNMNNKRWHT